MFKTLEAGQDVMVVGRCDLLLNMARERSLILCSPLDKHSVESMIIKIDSAWTVGESVECTRSTLHRHWVLNRR